MSKFISDGFLVNLCIFKFLFSKTTKFYKYFYSVKKKEAEPVKDRVELPTLNQVNSKVLV